MTRLQIYGIAVIITLMAIFGIYRTGYKTGWSDRDAEMQAEIARKNEEARQTEQRLTAQINDNASKLLEANHALDEKQSDLDRAIRAGRVRIRTASCVQASPSAAPAARDRHEARSQPDRQADQAADADRETLAAIAAIVADGDRAINQLNACIDAYNQVRENINAQ